MLNIFWLTLSEVGICPPVASATSVVASQCQFVALYRSAVVFVVEKWGIDGLFMESHDS